MPLYKLIGATRDRIPSYASTPMLHDVPAYLDFVETLLDQGFNAVKFHTWCIPEQDAALARAVRHKHPGDDIAFMLDAENNYDRESALWLLKSWKAWTSPGSRPLSPTTTSKATELWPRQSRCRCSPLGTGLWTWQLSRVR